MLRSLVAITAVALIATPIFAADPAPPTLESLAKKIDDLAKTIDELSKTTTALKNRVDVSDAARLSISETTALTQQMSDLRSEISRLRSDLESHRTRESRSSPLNSGRPDGRTIPPTATDPAEILRPPMKAFVRVTNQFVTAQRVVVNGDTIVVRGGETLDISVDAGTFTFQAVDLPGNDGMPRTREVPAGKIKPFVLGRAFAPLP